MLTRIDSNWDLQLLSAYLSDLQFILQQLFPSTETNFYQHAESVSLLFFKQNVMHAVIVYSLLKIHTILDEVLF